MTTPQPTYIEIINKVNVLLRNGRLNEAEEMLGQAAERFPGHSGVRERHAHVALRRLDFEVAFARYEALRRDHPDNPAGHIGLCNVLLQQNRLQEAEEAIGPAAERFPGHSGVRERHAHVALRRLDFEVAFARYEALRRDHPDNPAGYFGLGNVLLQQNRFDEAFEKFTQSLEVFKENLNAMKLFIHVYVKSLIKNIHLHSIRGTELAFSAYSKVKEHAGNSDCFDHDKQIYASLEASKIICQVNSREDVIYKHGVSGDSLRSIAIFGDSHVVPNFYYIPQYVAMGFRPTIVSIPGASIAGLGKLNSTLKLLPFMNEYLSNYNPEYTLLKLGQVDIEFGYCYKKFVKKDARLNFDEYIDQLVDLYINNIYHLKKYTKLVVCSVNLPSLLCRRQYALRTLTILTEGVDVKSKILTYKKLHALLPSALYRTKASIRFNNILKYKSESVGIQFIDHTRFFIDSNTELLNMYNQSDNNHHCVTSDFFRASVIRNTINNLE